MKTSARVGLIIYAPNTNCEPAMYAMAPEGVTIHTERTTARTSPTLEEEDIPRAINVLMAAQVDVLAQGSTAVSFRGGVGSNDELTRIMENASGGVPAVTTSSAVLQALKFLGVKKVCAATPYPDHYVQGLETFLIGNGFDVLSIEGLPTQDTLERGALPPESAYDMAKSIFTPEADAVFLSCTNWKAVEVVDQLERELKRPVVTSNQALLWACMRRVGVTGQVIGYGQLFSNDLSGQQNQADNDGT